MQMEMNSTWNSNTTYMAVLLYVRLYTSVLQAAAALYEGEAGLTLVDFLLGTLFFFSFFFEGLGSLPGFSASPSSSFYQCQ